MGVVGAQNDNTHYEFKKITGSKNRKHLFTFNTIYGQKFLKYGSKFPSLLLPFSFIALLMYFITFLITLTLRMPQHYLNREKLIIFVFLRLLLSEFSKTSCRICQSVIGGRQGYLLLPLSWARCAGKRTFHEDLVKKIRYHLINYVMLVMRVGCVSLFFVTPKKKRGCLVLVGKRDVTVIIFLDNYRNENRLK